MSKKMLTHSIVCECIAGSDRNAGSKKGVTVLAVILFAIGLIGFAIPFVAPLCWGIAIVCLIMKKKSTAVTQAVLQKDYILRQDVCSNKGYSRSTEGPDTPYLVFANTGHCDLSFPHARMYTEAALHVPNIYETTQIGDSVYLLCVEGNKILYVFSQEYWEVSSQEFSQNGDIFGPRV